MVVPDQRHHAQPAVEEGLQLFEAALDGVSPFDAVDPGHATGGARGLELALVADQAEAVRPPIGELARRRGEVTAEVVAARVLTDEQQQALADALRSAAGSKIQVSTKVDPGLTGGLVVRVGSRMVDSSLRSKLEKMQYAMKGVA